MKSSCKLTDVDRLERNGKGHHSCHQLLAYWIAPPTWPRRVFCDHFPNLGGLLRDTRACWSVVAALVVTYLAIMDIILYSYFRRSNLVNDHKRGGPEELYSPFTHLSVKTLMLDEPSQFLKTPTAEYFNTVTRFSSHFAFVTPNVISVCHLVSGFLAGKFIASSVLNDRRIGVALFCFRSWLDALDGVVFRAQSHLRLQFQSHPSTTGYFIDAGFDTLGGFFLCFGVLYHLLKRFGPRQYRLLPMWRTAPVGGSVSSTSSSSSSSVSASHVCSMEKNGVSDMSTSVKEPLLALDHCELTTQDKGESEVHSVSFLFTKTLTLGMCLGMAGMGWNYSMQGLSTVFQTDLADENLSILQFQHCHSNLTMAVFVAYRFLGSMAILNYIMLALFFDRIWEFLQGPQLIVLGLNALLLPLSYLYIQNLRDVLKLQS